MAGATLIGGGVRGGAGGAGEAAAGLRGEVGEAVTGEAVPGPWASALVTSLAALDTLATGRVSPAARITLGHAGAGLQVESDIVMLLSFLILILVNSMEICI